MTAERSRALSRRLALAASLTVALGAAGCKERDKQAAGTGKPSPYALSCPADTHPLDEELELARTVYCVKQNAEKKWVKHGPYRHWYANGKLASDGHYSEDKRDGVWKTYYEGGARQSQGAFAADKRVGQWQSWHPGGKKRSQGRFRAGKPHGLWQAWDAAGKRTVASVFSAGQLRQHKQWVADARKSGLPRAVLRHTTPRSLQALLRQLTAAAGAYFRADRFDRRRKLLPHTFPPGRSGWVPPRPCCEPCDAKAHTLKRGGAAPWWKRPPYSRFRLRPVMPGPWQVRYEGGKDNNLKARYTLQARLAPLCRDRSAAAALRRFQNKGGGAVHYVTEATVNKDYRVRLHRRIIAPEPKL